MDCMSYMIENVWSRKYSQCQNPKCITPEAKHWSKGLCSVCYQSLHYANNKESRMKYFEKYREKNPDRIKQINREYNATKRVHPKKTGIWSIGTRVQLSLGSYKLFGKVVKRVPSQPFHLLNIRLDSGKLCKDVPTSSCIPIDSAKQKKLKRS